MARTAGSRGKAPSAAQAGGIDLSTLFGAAAQALVANQGALNQADTENQNHGDNMVQAFSLITQALAGQHGSPTQQLSHASQYLAQHGTSGSAQVYSQGLAQAAQQFQGQPAVTPDNAMTLVQALLGGGQQQAGGADLLGSLLGGAQQGSGLGSSTAPQQSAGADLIGALLGGGQQAAQPSQQSGLDMGDLLNAGMAFMNAKQQGQDNLQAALSALMSAGPMAKPHRQQSGQLVANALLQAVSAMAQRR